MLAFWDLSTLSPFMLLIKTLGSCIMFALKHPKGKFIIQNEFLFKGTRLCISRCGTCELLSREVYRGSLAGNYMENKS